MIERDLEVITQTIPVEDLVMVDGKPSAELQSLALRHYMMVMPSFTGDGFPATLEEKWLFPAQVIAGIETVYPPETLMLND